VLAVSNEYSTGMIRVTLAAMPRGLTMLAAKAALVVGLVLAAAPAAVLACELLGRVILPGALLSVFPIVASVAGDPHWQRHLEQIGPMTAGLCIQATVGVKTLPLTPWQGLGVLAAWACGALLLGAVALCLRDA
jgi:ABC-2 type transport system permease protein